MARSKKETEKRLQQEHAGKARELLSHPEYREDLEEFEEYIKRKNFSRLERQVMFHSICSKYDIPYPYSIEELDAATKLQQELTFRTNAVVESLSPRDCVPVGGNIPRGEHSYLVDDKDYVYLKVSRTAPRRIIHMLVDQHIDSVNRIVPLDRDAKKRFRSADQDAIRVWELRQLRKPYKEISSKLGINEDTARKRFYRAYEIYFGKPFRAEDYTAPEIKKSHLEKICETCGKWDTCTVPCPDAITYIDQDKKSSSTGVSIGNEDFLDKLAQKKNGRVPRRKGAE